jgi:hypothetical protein
MLDLVIESPSNTAEPERRSTEIHHRLLRCRLTRARTARSVQVATLE